MAVLRGDGAPKLRRFAGVVSGVAATALCVSFAWTIVGGALCPASCPLPDSIVIASASQAIPQPPLIPRHRPSSPRGPVRLSAAETQPSSKTSPAGATTTPELTPASDNASLGSQIDVASSLLRTETKASRTRGQPGQN